MRVRQDIFKSTCRSPFVVDVSATGGARLCNAAVTETIHNPWTRELLEEVRPCTDFETENPTPCTDFETKKSTHRVHDHFSVYTSMSDDVSLGTEAKDFYTVEDGDRLYDQAQRSFSNRRSVTSNF